MLKKSIGVIKSRRYTGGNDLWKSLKGITIYNKNICIENMGDIHPFNGITFKCDTLFLDNCDKNFVYYWLNKNTFPNLEKVYLNSHPCEPTVFHKFIYGELKDTRMYIHERFSNYVTRWGTNRGASVIIVTTNDDYKEAKAEYESEKIIRRKNI